MCVGAMGRSTDCLELFFTYRSNYTVEALHLYYVLCFTQLQKDRKQLQTETRTKRQQNKNKVTQKSLQREKNECTK